MKKTMHTFINTALAGAIAFLFCAGCASQRDSISATGAGPQEIYTQGGEAQPPAEEVTPDTWPRTAGIGGATYSIFQPQMDSWDGHRLKARAAVSVLPAGTKEPEYGLVEFTANTHVFKLSRTVEFHDVRVATATFPSAPGNAASYRGGFQSMVSNGPSTMSLDRFEAMMAITGAEKAASRVPVKNDPPDFVFSRTSAVLVAIDGPPVWRPVAGTSLERVLNTRPLVLLDDRTGTYYIHLFDGFVAAKGLTGPWTLAADVPAGIQQVAKELGEKKVVDLMEGSPDPDDPKKAPSLKNGVPSIVVATSPTELVVTEGEPEWASVDGTMLLYVKNTTANVFNDLNDQRTYVLVTGRWFSAPGLSGPWKFVPGKDLPPDFAKIPDDSPKENVKASLPGTPQAEAAAIATYIPQTATVNRTEAIFTPVISGDPVLKPIPDTPLMYVFNSPDAIIMVSATQWYAVRNGVWFTAASIPGPWVVATSIPASIYSIPPSSPLHYVTYVKIYEVTPATVVVGYTPGYMGTVVTPDGTVVYGTGYSYASYVGPAVWYPPPVTYGYAAAVTWTPWTGWAVGFGFGWAMGAMYGSGYWGYACAPYWGAMPYAPYAGAAYGPHGSAAVWGPGGWAATSGNVYSHWGSTTAATRTSAGYNAWTGNAWSSKVGTSYNSTTGRISAGQQASVSNVYTGNYAYGQRGATYNPTTGTSARGGSVTYGNPATGAQGTAKWGQVTGPGGQTTSAVKSGNNVYAGHDGNVYKDTGSGWQKYDNGGWNDVQKPASASSATQSLDAQAQARQAGDQRSASSSWGSKDWGGGFGGGGWDRGGGGFGGGRSWGGGGFGGFRGRR